MTTLRPTRSSRGPLHRVPVWLIVVAAGLVGVLLIGAGLLLFNGGDDNKASSTVSPTCTPTKSAASATKPPTKKVEVNVYNSTTRIGLAAETATSMESRGFVIGKVTNDPEKATIDGSAVVRYVPGTLTSARWVAAQVPGATVVKVPAKGHEGADVDLVIGKGFDALASSTDAKTAFAASVPTSTC